jgi:2'-5' RNA ligase
MERAGDRRPARARRLFVAVEVPPHVHPAIDAALAPWRSVVRARWVAPEHRHVTVRFVGSVAETSVGVVERAMAVAAGSVGPIDARLTGLGAFPSSRRAAVLWVGLEDGGGRMAALATILNAALPPEHPAEARPFRPHVTVARCRPPDRLPDAFPATPVEPVAFRIVRTVLFESVPTGGPPRYDVVASAELAG